MPNTASLISYVDQLPLTWKWSRPFSPPAHLTAEWQAWLAQAQRAEEAATLKYWTTRDQKTA